LGKIYGINGALVRNLLGEFGEQIQNMINYHWALGGNMKEPYGINLRTLNSKKIPFSLSPPLPSFISRRKI
jgi:hypothetical protein